MGYGPWTGLQEDGYGLCALALKLGIPNPGTSARIRKTEGKQKDVIMLVKD